VSLALCLYTLRLRHSSFYKKQVYERLGAHTPVSYNVGSSDKLVSLVAQPPNSPTYLLDGCGLAADKVNTGEGHDELIVLVDELAI
jgi:hypothetical protein